MALGNRIQAYRQDRYEPERRLNAVVLSRSLTELKNSQSFFRAASAMALNNVKRRGGNVFGPGERLKLPKLGDCRVVWS